MYRRNADTHLRQTERDYQREPTLETLLAYNRARLRAGQPPIRAAARMVRQILSQLKPYYWYAGIPDTQFDAVEALPDIMNLREAGLTSVPRNQAEHQQLTSLLVRCIPQLLEVGWVALIKQCGSVSLRIQYNSAYDEYDVLWREDGELIESRTYSTADHADAERYMQETLEGLHPREYPGLVTLPASIMQPSGRITLSHLVGELIADEWQKDSDPLTLTDPSRRRGSYPTSIILIRAQDLPPSRSYITWRYIHPYDPGVNPSRDRGHYEMTREDARIDYLCRLLKLPAGCSYQLYE